MARHRAPRRRGRGHPEPQPPTQPPTGEHPPTDPELTEAPWLRLVQDDPLGEPPEPAPTPVELLTHRPEVTVVYPSGERVHVPVVDGMALSLSFLNGSPRIGVNLA